ncbi:hypothetical protein J4209_00250 [Candidatus Woesearchaeota archaeon]|nr:hypothetical protein [Candidatus Woesearchaeota archaeon]
MSDISIIETGVDRLVELVKLNNRISVIDAAKKLGVSREIIEEWADFLEEEGIISIEYKFTTPYLVERKLTKVQVEKKAKEFHGKKEVFIRKAEMTLGSLDKEAQKLRKLKGEFDKLKGELGLEIDNVKEELKELERYEKLKTDIDAQALIQKKETNERFEDLNKKIQREQRRYQELLEDIRQEEIRLDKDKSEAISIEEGESILKRRLAGLKLTIKKLEEKIEDEGEIIKNSEKHIDRLKEFARSVEEKVEKDKEEIRPLIEESKKQEEKISALQRDIIKQVLDREKKLKNAREISNKFKEFFDKKLVTLELVDKINKDRDELERDLVEIIRKAKSFQLSSKSEGVEKQVTELEKKFKEIDKKKGVFEEELKKLGSLLKKS